MSENGSFDESVLREIVRRLVEVYRPVRIYLYGSRARGEATEDSDYDLAMIVAASDLPMYRRVIEALRVLADVRADAQVIVWTEAEFARKLSVVASLPATVEREGLLLYAA